MGEVEAVAKKGERRGDNDRERPRAHLGRHESQDLALGVD
jgi:hypothetical protein